MITIPLVLGHRDINVTINQLDHQYAALGLFSIFHADSFFSAMNSEQTELKCWVCDDVFVPSSNRLGACEECQKEKLMLRTN